MQEGFHPPSELKGRRDASKFLAGVFLPKDQSPNKMKKPFGVAVCVAIEPDRRRGDACANDERLKMH
jgi:hypothetical protein